MKLISVELIGNPFVGTRAVLPYTPLEDKNKKPFIAYKAALIIVKYQNKKKNIIKKVISNESGYCYDGASIPLKIGKSDMRLLIPALYHDIMCEDKRKIDYQRNLSSLIFRELLIQCGVNKVLAQIMYLAVDNYQKLIKEWRVHNE